MGTRGANRIRSLWGLLAAGCLCLCGPAPSALGQVVPFLVADINTDDPALSSEPQELVTIGDTTFFTATTLPTGRELWKTDGTEQGTVLVTDLWPGETGSWPHGLTEIDGELHFAARSPGRGLGFFKSDGTPEGTVPYGPTFPGRWGFREGVRLDQGAILVSNDTLDRMDIWFATEEEARRAPIPVDLYTSEGEITKLVGTDTQAFLAVRYTSELLSGEERLWRAGQVAVTDGTAEGNRQLTSFETLEDQIRDLMVAGDRAFFMVDRSRARSQLWSSDGSLEGTQKLLSKTAPRRIGLATSLGDVLYFQVVRKDGWRLWRSDGTPEGTQPVDGVDFSKGARTRHLVAWRGELYFDVKRSGKPPFLWRSDGTAEGTVRVRKFGGAGKQTLVSMTGVGPWLAFVMRTRVKGDDDHHTLWVTDGEADGPRPLVDNSGPIPDHRLAALGDELLFVPDDPETHEEIWISDGGENGARRLGFPEVGAPSSNPSGFASHDGWLYFTADDGQTGRELWRSDGTEEGTQRVADAWPGRKSSKPGHLTSVGERLYFSAFGKGGEHPVIWGSDGTEDGTGPLRAKGRESEFEVEERSSGKLAGLGSLLLFSPRSDRARGGLWTSDGTPAGTSKLAKLRVGYIPPDLFLGDRLCFSADDGRQGSEPWCSDGTAAGTIQIDDLYRGSNDSRPGSITVVGDRLYFTAQTPLLGRELWVSDGTLSGTRVVADLAPGEQSSSPGDLMAAGEYLYFSWTSPELEGRQLSRTDGTAQGTVLLRAIPPGLGAFRSFSGEAGVPYFEMEDEEHGRELWTSDGTADGTRMVVDLFPGPGDSWLWYSVAVGDRLVFRARQDDSGDHIYVTDGTAEGTQRIIEFSPDFQIRWSGSMVRVGDLIYFAAETVENGTELWAFSVDDLP